MLSLDDAALDPEQRAAVDSALAADPGLADELELIVGLFEDGARERFWRAFAFECRGRARPAAAVLAALEQAALAAPD